VSLKSSLAALSAGEPMALALRLTAIEVLLRPMGPGWLVAPLVLAGALALLATPALLSSRTWHAAAVLIAVRIVLDWPLPDNHIYLLGYWCFAIGLALGSRMRAETLAEASRLLLGLTFAFAVLWKGVLSPDYRDGRFFTVTLLTDVRFEDLTRRAGRMSVDALDHNRRVLAPLPDGAELVDPGALELSAAFRMLVAAATWGTLAVEAALAVLFLIPAADRRVDALRHGTLLTFCLVTYAVAPVAGFGWLLLAMGCSRCHPDQHALRALYVSAWFLVLFYGEVPVLSLLA
jgi:hypothetical protein